MTISIRLGARRGMAAMGLAAILLGSPTARAQSTWDGGGGDNNWGTAGNWNLDQVPAFPAALVFAGSTRPSPNNNLTNQTINGLNFDLTSGAFTLGGNSVTVAATALDPGIAIDNSLGVNNGGVKQSSPNAQVVGLPLALAIGRHVFQSDASSGSVTLNGAVTRQTGSNANFIVNDGNFVAGAGSGLVNDATGIIGGWATAGVTAATASWAARDGSGNIVPYTAFSHTFDGVAGFPIAGVTSSSNLNYTGNGAITVPSATAINTLLMSSDLGTIDTITVTDALTFSNGGGIYRSGDTVARHVMTGGSMTAGTSGPAELHLRQRTSPAPNPGIGPPEAFDIVTTITDNAGGGPVSVIKSGFGVTRWSPPTGNTFTGGLYVNEGQLRPTTVGSLGAATSPIYVAADAQVLVNTVSNIPNPWFIKGFGPQEQGGAAGEFRGGALRLNNVGTEISGTVTLLADAGIGGRGGQSAGPGQIVSGKITGNFALRLNRQTNQGAGATITTLDGTMPTLTLANSANDWTGDTSIGRGRIRIGGTGEVIPDGPGKGDVELVGEQAASATILNLAGQTETVNGLSSTGDPTLIFITNSEPDTTATLRVGNNNATSTFAGTITENFGLLTPSKTNLTKIGSGTLTLTGDNSYDGDTRIEGGVLSILDPGANDLLNASDVYLSSGAIFNLNFTGTDVIDSLFFNGVGQAIGTWGSLASTATNKSAFFTGSGLLNVSTVGMGPIPGDFNGDMQVDAADLTKWRTDFGAGAGSDADSDGDSDGADFLIWQRNFGTGVPSGAAGGAVPEPGAVALAGLAALTLGLKRRKRG